VGDPDEGGGARGGGAAGGLLAAAQTLKAADEEFHVAVRGGDGRHWAGAVRITEDAGLVGDVVCEGESATLTGRLRRQEDGKGPARIVAGELAIRRATRDQSVRLDESPEWSGRGTLRALIDELERLEASAGRSADAGVTGLVESGLLWILRFMRLRAQIEGGGADDEPCVGGDQARD
jgi:hypothetical protein